MKTKTSNLKDTVSNVAKWMITIGTFLIGLPASIFVAVPEFTLLSKTALGVIAVVGIVLVGLGSAITSHFTGKNPDGTTKTPTQVITTNQTAAETKVN